MAKLFGTDGIRGEAGVFPLDEATVFKIGRSLAVRMAERLGRPPRFVTGRDTRESGGWIESSFSQGAAAGGAGSESAAVITTPGVAFLAAHFEFDLGIVISASHNPFEDNGIKAFLPSGRKIDDELERGVEADIAAGNDDHQPGSRFSLNDSRASAFGAAYLAHLRSATGSFRLDGYKIAADCANGAASELAPALFRGLGADVIPFNDRPDGRNINHDCGSLHLEHLQAKVTETGADLGVAFDGDADRALFVDDTGNVVDGDAALWVMAKLMQGRGELASGKVVATVMSNIGLEIALASRGIQLVRTAVGDKYVLDELLRSGVELGGEQSGHIIFPRVSLVGDGMMTALRVLEAAALSGKKLSELTEGFRRYPQVLVNVRVGQKKPFDEVEAIRKASTETEAALSGSGRLLLRYSGTENLARVMIEGRDQNEIEGLANQLANTIKAALG
ncbi:MAG: phosphoglucosamine mutase [Acidobacteria bacterium]|nr:phosphoglucosamine mutase [Acidobacteriota bacterium]